MVIVLGGSCIPKMTRDEIQCFMKKASCLFKPRISISSISHMAGCVLAPPSPYAILFESLVNKDIRDCITFADGILVPGRCFFARSNHTNTGHSLHECREPYM